MLALTNTLTRAKEPLRPRDAGQVRMYTCGPTVYRLAHIGNLRSFVLADLIRRVLEADGIAVRQVQNITDVGHLQDERFDRGEDKMLVSARLEEKTPAQIAEFYTGAFFADAAAVGIQPAHAYPRASRWVPAMQELVGRLLALGNAYEAGGNVYFSVESFPGYGKLSRNSLAQLRAGHRSDRVDEAKRHHADFVLWKSGGPGRLVQWDSPWGPGYPGWHLECSAMSLGELGEHVDVHTGGVDLTFPHHEDEIAQSESATGHQVVTTWVHGEHLLAEGHKMSKSAGNFYDLRDVEARGFEPLALRLLFLQTRYRAQLNFTWDALAAAETALHRLRGKVADWARDPRAGELPGCAGYEEQFTAAMHDDLDTPRALAVLAAMESDEGLPEAARLRSVTAFDRVLGLELTREIGRALPAGAQQLLDRREQARAARDFAAADALREELAGLDVEVTDTRLGTTWRVLR